MSKNRYSKSHVVLTQKGLIVHGCTVLKDFWTSTVTRRSQDVYVIKDHWTLFAFFFRLLIVI